MPVAQYDSIPIQNIWLLMLYASDFYCLAEPKAVALEHDADDLPMALLVLFIQLCQQHFARPVQRSYQRVQQRHSQVRGKINIAKTYTEALLEKGQIACEFDQLSFREDRYGYLLYVLGQLASRYPAQAQPLQQLMQQCRRLGVGRENKHYRPQLDRFNYHEQAEQQSLSLAELMLNFHLPTQEAGQHLLLQATAKSSHWLRQLFEKAIAGFYQKHASAYQVHRAVKLRWPVQAATQSAYLPHMLVDMILQHRQLERGILIDTKFTNIVRQGYYRSQALFKSEYIYQLYSYLRSQEQENAQFKLSHAMLLHPAIGQNFEEMMELQGYQLQFCTVDLSQSRQEISQRLLTLLP